MSEPRIARIKARLDAALECAWCDSPATGYAQVEVGYGSFNLSCGAHGAAFYSDADLAAGDKADLAYLLAENKRLQEGIGKALTALYDEHQQSAEIILTALTTNGAPDAD